MTLPISTPRLFAGGIYWRKSKFNGRQCVPAILELREGRVRLLDVQGQVFDVLAASVQASCSVLGTLSVVVDGVTYDLVAQRARLSPSFTAPMVDYLRDVHAQVVAVEGERVPGAVLMMEGLNARHVFNNVRLWAQLLA